MRKQLIAATGLNVVAQAVGFFKLWLIARLFGVGSELDGYYLALVAPTLLSGVFSGALQTGLFPVRARLAVAGDMDLLARFERAVLVGASALGVLIAVLLVVLGDALRAWVAPGASADTHAALRLVWPYAASLVALNAAGDTLSYLLAMRDRYAYAAAAPILNALVGAGVLLAWPEGGLTSLAVSTVAGVAMQVLMCAVVLHGSNFRLTGLLCESGESGRYLGDVGHLSIKSLPWLAVGNLTMNAAPVLLAGAAEGAVSAFSYASRLHSSLIMAAIMAGSPILLARFSELVTRRAEDAIARILRRALKWSAAAGLTIAAGVAVVGAPLLERVFSGRFDAVAAARVSEHWLWLSVGFSAAIANVVFTKLWQARERPLQLGLVYGIGFLLLVGAATLLEPWMREYAVAVGMSVSAIGTSMLNWAWERLAGSAGSKSVVGMSTSREPPPPRG